MQSTEETRWYDAYRVCGKLVTSRINYWNQARNRRSQSRSIHTIVSLLCIASIPLDYWWPRTIAHIACCAHLTLSCITILHKVGVEVFGIPDHALGSTQSLDVSVYSPFKATICVDWRTLCAQRIPVLRKLNLRCQFWTCFWALERLWGCFYPFQHMKWLLSYRSLAVGSVSPTFSSVTKKMKKIGQNFGLIWIKLNDGTKRRQYRTNARGEHVEVKRGYISTKTGCGDALYFSIPRTTNKIPA